MLFVVSCAFFCVQNQIGDGDCCLDGLLERGDLPAAESCLRRCLTIRRRYLQPDADEHRAAQQMLGLCLGRLGRHNEAVELFDAVLALGRPLLFAGLDPDDVLMNLRIARANANAALGRFHRAGPTSAWC